MLLIFTDYFTSDSVAIVGFLHSLHSKGFNFCTLAPRLLIALTKREEGHHCLDILQASWCPHSKDSEIQVWNRHTTLKMLLIGEAEYIQIHDQNLLFLEGELQLSYFGDRRHNFKLRQISNIEYVISKESDFFYLFEVSDGQMCIVVHKYSNMFIRWTWCDITPFHSDGFVILGRA